MNSFYFNPKTQRYHYANNHVMVGVAQLRSLVNSSIELHQNEANILTQKLFDKEITLGTWEYELAKQIKTATIQAYKIGKPELTNSDLGRIGNYLKFQYAKLRQFSREIEKGNLSEAQINARKNLYFNKIREAHQEATRLSHGEAGFLWERRHLTTGQNCTPCTNYANLSWQKIGTLPKIGNSCTCMANCNCYFSFSKSSTKPTESLLTNSFGWLK